MLSRYVRYVRISNLWSIGVFALAAAACAAPTHVRWSDRMAVIEPTRLSLQGSLDVYSERFVAWEEDVPRVTRRPVNIYSVDGQLVAQAHEQDGESPIHFELSPGRYVVASEDQQQWRRLQVEVKEKWDTVVAESQWDTAPLLAALGDADRSTQMATQWCTPCRKGRQCSKRGAVYSRKTSLHQPSGHCHAA